MNEKGEHKDFILSVIYSVVFAITLLILIYSISNYPPDSYMGFFERQQKITTNFKLVLFLGVISMTMILSLLMLITNIYLRDESSMENTVRRIDRKVKGDLKVEVERIKKELKKV